LNAPTLPEMTGRSARRGRIDIPADLAHHPSIGFSASLAILHWAIAGLGIARTARPR